MKIDKIYMIKCTHYCLKSIRVQPAAVFERFFSSEEAAHKWLKEHGFIFGQCEKFKPAKEDYWYHKYAEVYNHILVEIKEISVDIPDEEDWVTKWMTETQPKRL